MNKKNLYAVLFVLFSWIMFTNSTCKFGTKSQYIPPEIKTFSIELFTNKASIVNPQLAPRLTDRFRQKIINQTSLRPISDNGDYHISGYVSSYAVSTSGIVNGVPGNNRLTVGFHVSLKDNKLPSRSFEADVTRAIEFSANQSLTEAEASKQEDIIKNVTDEIFNRIFSNW
jgi:Lipopolysaccharide-assembly